MRQKWICSVVLLFTFIACNLVQEKTKKVSTIDNTLQVKVDSILQDKLTELNALSGQAIVMEVQTGQVKAMVSLEKKDSYVPFEYQAQPSGLASTVSILAALETGKVKMSDTVDVGEGIYIVDDLELKDHNWHRGGYGKITLKQAIGVSSNVGIYKTMEKAFEIEQAYIDMLKKMNYGASMDSVHSKTALALACIGYNQTIKPLQMLTFYNAIANNGKMVQPQLYQDSIIVINPQIASKENIDSMQVALKYVVAEALGKAAHSDKVAVSGKTGTIIVSENEDNSEGRINTEFVAEFCGYFPSDNPKYSVIVTINKMGLPVSGGLMAGDVFRQISDCMMAK